ncbi:MAG: methyltransferase domain-containing protein [Woeseiaceae bacterium]|nr:methyltransferase domain-containing protein [Woeseiaceae bacterium]
MNTRLISVDSNHYMADRERPSWLDRLARSIVLSKLEDLAMGQIVITENGEHTTYGRLTDEYPLTAHVQIRDPKFYSDIAFGGSIGAGEAYINGYWSSNELSDLLRIIVRNRSVLENMDSGLATLSKPLQKVLHACNKNTRKGSRKNIAAHYDLGNDFYRLWLDEKMMYSSAYFETSETSLEDASIEKLDRICRKLDLSADDRVMEIGTGWGGFAIHAAKHYGCHVTTTTISKQQFEWAKRAIRAEGLEDRITLLFEDYRDLRGQFDKLVSIEMIEAVGHRFHSTYFRKCCELLKPDGQMLLQAITIADQNFDSYKNSVDFINRYIFPGGCLTSVTDMTQTLTRHTDMRVLHIEDIGPHYATTLRHWHDRFMARLDEVIAQGYPDTFIRMWQFYLAYCEAAFLERAIGDVQMLMMRPDARRDSIQY